MGIRSELILFFLLISVIPLSAVVYTSYDHSKNAIRDSVTEKLLSATENTGLAIDNWMDARKDDIRVISSISANLKKEELLEFFNTFKTEHEGVYKEFFIIDMNGKIILSTLDRTGNAGKERYFTEALKDKLFVSDVHISGITEMPEIIITNPVRKNGTISAILGARVSMENLYRIIEGIDAGKSNEIFIVNNEGEIIFHKDRSKILFENINNNFAVREVTYEKNGIGEYTNYKGKKVLGSYYWLALYRWGLIVEENRSEAYAQVHALSGLIITISITAILGVVFLAVVLSRRITKPIKSLADGAIGLPGGNFKPIRVISENEIGKLTEIFNQTAKELIEARKKLETRIELANKDLEEKNRELVNANKELKKLDRLKSDFISLVSHELRTPLTAIKTSAEFLESEDNVDPAVKKNLISIIIRNIDRQTQMINDILDLSKIEAGKMEFKFGRVEIREIFTIVLENFRQIALKKNISISVDVPNGYTAVFADKEKLIIVLNNLIGNALKFTPDGGEIVLSAIEHPHEIEIRVKDTGIGIEKDELKKIFFKFYQVDSTSRRKIGGSGLGLSISRGIIRAHDSELRVESEPGKGSTFYFMIKKYGER